MARKGWYAKISVVLRGLLGDAGMEGLILAHLAQTAPFLPTRFFAVLFESTGPRLFATHEAAGAPVRDASDMQLLCSRASEALLPSVRTCTHIVSHRAVRRIAIHHRRSKHSQIYTALYAADAGPSEAAHHDGLLVKMDRKDRHPRKGWALPPPKRRRLPDMEIRQRPPSPRMGAIHALNSICDTEEALLRNESSRHNHKKFLRALHRSYDPDAKLSSSHHANYLGPNMAAVQLTVEEEQRQDDTAHREPMSTLQFERYHDMINNMVDRLIIQSYYDELPADPALARMNVESLDSAWTAIRLLRSEGYPRYNHPSADAQATKQARDHLADKIRELFGAWATANPGTKPKFQVAKICYNLLVCPVPPSIHHFNLLLLGFSQKAAYSLVDIVAEVFLEKSRLRPTPQTVVCLLHHFRFKKDILGFYAIIRRMMAIDNRGMLIRRRWYEDVVKIPALHQWARQPEVTTSLQANWVIERPSRGQDIYEALVSGLLWFDRVKDAVKVFVGSLEEGMGTSIELFIYLIKHVRYMLDAPAAAILLRGLLDNVDVVVALLLRDDCPKKLIQHLYPLINMADPPSSDFSEERVRTIWNSATMETDAADLGRVRRIKRAIFIRSTETYLGRLQKRLRTSRYLWRVRNLVDRAVLAQHCVDRFGDLDEHPAKQSGMVLKDQTLQMIVKKLEDLTWPMGPPERLALVHRRVMGVLGDNIPRPQLGAGYDEWDRLAMIGTAADTWLEYRISSRRGITSDTLRFRMHAELVLLTGRRVMDDLLELLHLKSPFGWRRLDRSKP